MYNRRFFIKNFSLFSLGALTFPSRLFSQPKEKLDKDLVFEFVKAGHNNLDKVKQLLEKKPMLINSSWDWGKGDFETAIGGAGHVGNKEIAEYLLSKGARINLFTLAMLGENDSVISALERYPSLISSKGPHGFTLLHHAKMGGTASENLFDYLVQKGLKKTKID